MKYNQEVRVPAAYFYKTLIDSARHEIQSHGGQATEGISLEGIIYSKSLGANQTYEVEIVKDVPNQAYSFVSRVGKRTYTSDYQIEEQTKDTCRVTYSEEIATESSLLQLNDALVGKLLAKSKKRRITLLFASIEQEFNK